MSTISPTPPPTDFDLERSANSPQPTRKIRLGEELPIFCEKCGYALHGLAQQVCGHCQIRQFHCPECGHHQPINTLRPAAQKILGRLRAVFLALLIFLKINFFGWLLIAFASLGYECAYRYYYDYRYYSSSSASSGSSTSSYSPPRLRVRELETEDILGFSISGFFFGMVGRMFLLRWRRGYLVGLALATLVALAMIIGAMMRRSGRNYASQLPSPYTGDFLTCIFICFAGVVIGAAVVWLIWSALIYVFLPKRTGQALLDWQREQSLPAVAHIGRG